MSRGVLEASRELWAVEGRLGRVAEEVAALDGRSSWSNSIPFSPEKKYFFKSVVKHSSTCIGAGKLTCVRGRNEGFFCTERGEPFDSIWCNFKLKIRTIGMNVML